MVAKLTFIALLALALAGCQSEQAGGDISLQGEQPPADFEAGRNAQSIEQWSQANPNNGAPGSGGEGK